MKSEVMNQIRTAYKEAMDRLEQPAAELVWEDREQYGDWLGQMYYFLCHATRLLSAAAARLTIENDDLHMRMIDHCQQEKTHERQALRDLQALGFKYTDFPQYPPTAMVYQAQYYMIDYLDPAALFGCVLCLEGYSLHSLQKAYQRAKKAHGDKATLFLRTHTQEDEEHIEQAFKIIEKCSEQQLQSVLWSLQVCDFAYSEMMKQIVRNAKAARQTHPETRAA